MKATNLVNPNPEGINGTQYYAAMTIRDYIAIKAMQGILSSPDGEFTVRKSIDDWTKEISTIAYKYADAMIAESEKNNG